jgi:hypothetical protein
VLCLLLVGRKIKEKEKVKCPGSFVPRAGHALVAVLHGISQLLGAIKFCFKGQSFNFMCT